MLEAAWEKVPIEVIHDAWEMLDPRDQLADDDGIFEDEEFIPREESEMEIGDEVEMISDSDDLSDWGELPDSDDGRVIPPRKRRGVMDSDEADVEDSPCGDDDSQTDDPEPVQHWNGWNPMPEDGPRRRGRPLPAPDVWIEEQVETLGADPDLVGSVL